jgi:hypothetical protein
MHGDSGQHVSVAEVDRVHLARVRSSVDALLSAAATEILKATAPSIVDIAPQVHSGIAPYLSDSHTVRTIDIDPECSPDIVGDICAEIPEVATGSVDFLICTEVLEHVSNPFSATAEMWRMLKPGGMLFCSSPFDLRIHGPLPDNWRFTEHGWRELLKLFSTCIIEHVENPERPLMPIHYSVIAVK